MTKLINKVKLPIQNTNKLSYIFNQQPNLAWDMLEQQCNIYTNPNVDVQEINKLSSIYCKILLKLNDLQDPRQKYFNNKMQKLMAQPFIIRCYNDSTQKKNTNINLSHKRKQLQQKLSLQNEKQNNQIFQHILQSQNQKQKKLKQKITQVIVQHQKNLQNRLQLRSMKKTLISPMKKNSQDIRGTNSQYKNPQLLTPKKSTDSQSTSIQLLINPKNHHSDIAPSNRPNSQRIINYKFNKLNIDSSSDSQDQYHIQKLLKQQKIYMAKKKQSLFQQNIPK